MPDRGAPNEKEDMTQTQRLTSFALGAIGALIGSAIGPPVFLWIASQGFYAVALPGAFVGVGAGIGIRHRSHLFAAACGVWAAFICVYSEWKFGPFIADDSFSYFLRNLGELKPITLIMILFGAALGYWFSLGGVRTARHAMKERLIKAAEKDS